MGSAGRELLVVVVELEPEVEVEAGVLDVEPVVGVGALGAVLEDAGLLEVDVEEELEADAVGELELAVDDVGLEVESVVDVVPVELVDPVADAVTSDVGSHESVSDTMTPSTAGTGRAVSGVPDGASNENVYVCPPCTSTVTTQVSADAAGRAVVAIATRVSPAAERATISLRRPITRTPLLYPRSS